MLPYYLIPVFPETFIIKPINLIDFPILMVAPQYCYPILVSDLETEYQGECLNTL